MANVDKCCCLKQKFRKSFKIRRLRQQCSNELFLKKKNKKKNGKLNMTKLQQQNMFAKTNSKCPKQVVQTND